MGQQQLLLLVMGVVIVGLAIAAGWEFMDRGFKQNDADVIVNRCLSIATDAVFWKTKNDPYYQGNAPYTQLEDGGFAKLFIGEETENGLFQITSATEDMLEVTAVSKRYPEIGVRITVNRFDITQTEVDYSGNITLNIEPEE